MTRPEKPGNFKALFIKLSSTALGLVVMMSAAVYVGPMVLSHDDMSDQVMLDHRAKEQAVARENLERSAEKAREIAMAQANSRAFSTSHSSVKSDFLNSDYANSEFNVSMSLGDDFKQEMETHRWQAERALEEARQSLNNMQAERFETMISVQSEKIHALNDAIEEIRSQDAIPGAIKENLIADLERQVAKIEQKIKKTSRHLEKTSEALSLREDHVLTFAYNAPEHAALPKSTFKKTYKCTEEEIVIEKCDGDCGAEKSKTRDTKGSVEAFYWI